MAESLFHLFVYIVNIHRQQHAIRMPRSENFVFFVCAQAGEKTQDVNERLL